MALDFLPTAVLCDVAPEPIALLPRVRRVWRTTLAGPAVTVRTPPGELASVMQALNEARAGDVLVVDGGGSLATALFGDRLSKVALDRGLAGLVVDGAVRDADGIEELGFPVFAAGIVPNGPGKDVYGEVGIPIECAGRRVRAGGLRLRRRRRRGRGAGRDPRRGGGEGADPAGGRSGGTGVVSDPGTAVSETPSPYDEVLRTLSAIERRVLWLAVRIVDYANRERPKDDELKVGGHQASSASMVTLMTALYLADLDARGPGVGEAARLAGAARDRVPARPARPLVPDAAARLRRPAVVPVADEGSVPGRLLDRLGRARLGRAALRRAGRPLTSARTARRLDRRPLHLAARRRRARRGEHLGGAGGAADAEARQRAVDRRPEPAVARPRHSRDQGGRSWRRSSETSGLGRDRAEVRAAAAGGVRAGGRRRCCGGGSTRCRTSSTSRCSAASEEVVRETLLDGARRVGAARALRAAARPATRAGRATRVAISAATTSGRARGVRGARGPTTDRPTVIFAYTIKGYGLEIAGRPQNHSALLDGEQIDALPRGACGLTPETEWDAFAPDSHEGELLARRRRSGSTAGDRGRRRRAVEVPATLSTAGSGPKTSTQAAFGRTLLDLSRVEGVGGAARHGRRRTCRSRRTSAASSTRWASGAPRRSRSTTRWRTRR